MDKFCSALGQNVSLAKSRMLVSPNVKQSRAKCLSDIAKIPLTKHFGKYLCTLMIHGKIIRLHILIINKIKKKLENWSNKFLSMAGHIALVKFVTNTMAAYLMQTTLLSNHVS